MPPKRGRRALTSRNEETDPSSTKVVATKRTRANPAEKKRAGPAKGKKSGRKMEADKASRTKKRKQKTSEENGQLEEVEKAPPTKRKKNEPKEETDSVILTGAPPTSSRPQKQNQKQSTSTVAMETNTQSPSVFHPSHSIVQGEVFMMGQGDVGQLGLGEDVMEKKKPFPVSQSLAGKAVSQVVCGGMHTVCLTTEGKVYTWGCNDEGALGRKTEEGQECEPGLVGALEQVKTVQVSAGDSHTAALAKNGNVYCWGVFRDSNGPFGLIKNTTAPFPELVYSSSFNRAVKISSGSDHVVILTEQGDVMTFGCAEQGQLGRVPECFSTRGGRKGIGMLLHPEVVRFKKTRGQGKPKFSDVFCGSYHTFAVTQDQSVYGWGLNNYGQLGTDDLQNRFQPQQLPSDWVPDTAKDLKKKDKNMEIVGGQHHTLVLANQLVYSIGRKEYGRLGLGENCEERHTPSKVPNLATVESVACGSTCSFAVTQLGEAFSWGMGTNLQLGTGEEDDVCTPTKITAKKIENRKVLSVTSGGQHTALLVQREFPRD